MAVNIKKGTTGKVVPLKPKAKTGPKPMPADKYLAVLEWIKRGESLSNACKRPHMPAESTFHAWRNKDPHNDQLYRDALSFATDGMVDSVFPMLDNLFHGLTKVSEAGRLGRARIRVQHIQWLAARRDPEHYGAAAAGEDNTFKLDYSPDDHKPKSKGAA